jgi:hypothetical protein
MYSNNFSNFGSSSSGMSSQNQGFQRQYQPTGNVQSVYGQNAGQGNQGYGQNAGQGNQGYGQNAGQGNQGYGQNASSSYQTANYRGNQQGHDAGLRADSLNPSQMQSGGNFGSSNNYSSVNYGIRGNQQQGGYNNVSSQLGFNSSPYSSMGQSGFGNQGFGSSFGQGTEAFHTANYRGNQQGHDAGLRADSVNPSQQGGASTNFSSSAMMNQSAMGPSNFGQSGYSNQGSSFGQGQGQGTEAFHTANYRGNQQGHDAGLRADSLSPAEQGGGAFSGTNFSSPSYGIRGRENINSGLNNVSSQFGFSQSPYSSNQNQSSF